ncbi:unnamed protein product [Closterium sp. NIES-53]
MRGTGHGSGGIGPGVWVIGGGSAGDSLGNKVDASQVARQGCTRRRRHHHKLAKHEVATSLDIKPLAGTDSPCVSCVGGKLARHTFPDKGSDTDDGLVTIHIDLCGPFWVAAKDGSLYFLLLKDRKTRYVWVRPIARKADVLWEFKKWLVVAEWQTKKSVLMLRSNRGGEFLGKEFTTFVDGKGIVHDLTCPYPAAEWHGGARDADGGRFGADDATAHGRAAPLVVPCSAAGCLGPQLPGEVDAAAGDDAVPTADQQETRLDAGPCGLHLDVSEESKGWELLDLTNNRVVTTSDVVFYETKSLEVGEPFDEDAEDVLPPSSSPTPLLPPLVANLPVLTLTSASGDEESTRASSPMAPAKGITGGRRDVKQAGVGDKPPRTGEQQAEEVPPNLVEPAKEASARKPPTGEQPPTKPTKEQSTSGQPAREPTTGEQSARLLTVVEQASEGSGAGVDAGEQSGGAESTDSDVVEVNAKEPGPRRSCRLSEAAQFPDLPRVPTASRFLHGVQ